MIVVIDHVGNRLELDKNYLYSAGQAKIYKIKNEDKVAKLYNKLDDENKRDRLNSKLLFMIKNPPFNSSTPLEIVESIVWPEKVLYDKNNNFIGFTMPYIEKSKELTILTILSYSDKKDKIWSKFNASGNKFFLNQRATICYNLASVLQKIHESNKYVVVDLKPQNILINIEGKIALIDIDSIQVVTQNEIYHSDAWSEEYCPPEFFISKINPQQKVVESNWDYFNFGIIAYQLFFYIHPFMGRAGSNTLVTDNIKNRYFVHGKNNRVFQSILPPHNNFKNLNTKIKKYFIQTLDGYAQERIAFEEWKKCFMSFLKDLENTPRTTQKPKVPPIPTPQSKAQPTPPRQTKVPPISTYNVPPKSSSNGWIYIFIGVCMLILFLLNKDKFTNSNPKPFLEPVKIIKKPKKALKSHNIQKEPAQSEEVNIVNKKGSSTVQNIFNSSKGEITLNSKVIEGNLIELKVDMINFTKDRKKGWLSISFPQIISKDVIKKKEKRGFNRVYYRSRGEDMSYFRIKKNISGKYLLIEGSSDKWYKNSTKSITVTLKIPKNIRSLTVNLRGSYSSDGIKVFPDNTNVIGQQGFKNYEVRIPLDGSDYVESSYVVEDNLQEVVESIEGSEVINKEFLIAMSTYSYSEATKYAKRISKKLNIRFDEPSNGRYMNGKYITIEETNNYMKLEKGLYIVVVASGKDANTMLEKVRRVSSTAYVKKATKNNYVLDNNDMEEYQPIVQENIYVEEPIYKEEVIKSIESPSYDLGTPIGGNSTPSLGRRLNP